MKYYMIMYWWKSSMARLDAPFMPMQMVCAIHPVDFMVELKHGKDGEQYVLANWWEITEQQFREYRGEA